LAVRDRSELLDILRNLCYTMRQAMEDRISTWRDRIQTLVGSYSFNRPHDLLRESAQRVDELERSLSRVMTRCVERYAMRQHSVQQRLEALSPVRVLQRGYALVRKENVIVTSARRLHEGDRAEIQFHDGTVPTRVEKP
jgi:exodeoxyribonuclease VII large subunit